MLEGLCGGNSHGRIHLEHPVDEILGLGCDCVPFGRRVVVGSVLDLRVQVVLVLVPKGRIANQEDVENDTCFIWFGLVR